MMFAAGTDPNFLPHFPDRMSTLLISLPWINAKACGSSPMSRATRFLRRS